MLFEKCWEAGARVLGKKAEVMDYPAAHTGIISFHCCEDVRFGEIHI